MAAITIHGNIVEPDAQCEGGSQYAHDASNSNYILLQTKHLLTAEERDDLDRLGVRLQKYVGAETYICYYDPRSLDEVRKLTFIEYANVYHPDLVVEDNLKIKCGIQPVSRVYSASGEPLAREPTSHASEANVDIVAKLHENPERSPSQLKQALVDQLRLDEAKIRAEEGQLRIFGVDASALQQIATQDEVQGIEEIVYPTVHNHVARQDLDFVEDTALSPGITNADYSAEKIIVAVGDTGFDTGSTVDQHPAFHGRVKNILNENSLDPTKAHPSNADEWGHGTHVCGSVACNYNHPGSQFGLIRGTAPGAEIIMLAMCDNTGAFQPPTPAFWQHAFDTGARIHSNSYGLDPIEDPADKTKLKQRGYSVVSGDTDNFMKNNSEMLIVFSAGNYGDKADVTDTGATIGGYAVGKNCLTVGACESSKSMDRVEHYAKGGSMMGNRNNIAEYSNIGPTLNTLPGPATNSRIKPDLVAPGSIIYSTKSRFRPLKWPYDDYGTSTDDLFAFLSGTSMATPLVSGCAAVLRKILLKFATPGSIVPAVLIKALLINGAVDMDDFHQSRGPTLKGVPDNAQGFGRVSIATSIRNVTDTVNCGYQPNGIPVKPLSMIPSERERLYHINIPKAPKDDLQIVLKATMCYNDVGGATDLNNVLNLKATQDQGNPGAPDLKVKYGNTQTDKPDGLNNVQKVIWKDIHPGPATLTVECAAIRMGLNQDYALAWSIEYVKPGVSAGEIALYSLLGAAAVGLIAAVAIAAGHH